MSTHQREIKPQVHFQRPKKKASRLALTVVYQVYNCECLQILPYCGCLNTIPLKELLQALLQQRVAPLKRREQEVAEVFIRIREQVWEEEENLLSNWAIP